MAKVTMDENTLNDKNRVEFLSMLDAVLREPDCQLSIFAIGKINGVDEILTFSKFEPHITAAHGLSLGAKASKDQQKVIVLQLKAIKAQADLMLYAMAEASKTATNENS